MHPPNARQREAQPLPVSLRTCLRLAGLGGQCYPCPLNYTHVTKWGAWPSQCPPTSIKVPVPVVSFHP